MIISDSYWKISVLLICNNISILLIISIHILLQQLTTFNFNLSSIFFGLFIIISKINKVELSIVFEDKVKIYVNEVGISFEFINHDIIDVISEQEFSFSKYEKITGYGLSVNIYGN